MKLYIYPTFNPQRDTGGNLYLKFFHDSFKLYPQYNLVNRLWQIGISSIYFNLDADTFIIQWVDKIPFKRLAKSSVSIILASSIITSSTLLL